MAVKPEKLIELAVPFEASDVEWRIGQCGDGSKGVWARCLAYITNRAIMERLDAVCGPQNWRNEFKPVPSGDGVLCGLSILIDRGDGTAEWVTKWDGAEFTDVEATKGGISGAMKRAGVQWGIGRYLYDLEEGWAEIVTDQKANFGKTKKNTEFHWRPPQLPAWALPGGTGKPNVAPAAPSKPQAVREAKAERPASSGMVSIDAITDELLTIVDDERITARERNATRKWLQQQARSIEEISKAIDGIRAKIAERAKAA